MRYDGVECQGVIRDFDTEAGALRVLRGSISRLRQAS